MQSLSKLSGEYERRASAAPRSQPDGAERRASARHRVEQQACTIRVNGAEYRLEISDLSEHGLQGEVSVSIHAGQRIEILLPTSEALAATVRWGVGPYVGLEFVRAISLSELLGKQ